ncbi:MAG: hypothetical protein LGB07_05510 [Sulfurovum sp.]|nr:hypothetical protein [Sulfurovum sp.]
MNTARTAVGAASLDGLLYAVGGECAMAESQDDTLYLRCTECYDPVLKQWFLKSDMCKARSFVAVAAVGGYLYAIGGSVCWLSWSLFSFVFGGSLGKLQLLHLQILGHRWAVIAVIIGHRRAMIAVMLGYKWAMIGHRWAQVIM